MTQRRTPIVGGNWKMNTDLVGAVSLAQKVVERCNRFIADCDISIFPPFPYLDAVGQAIAESEVLLGAQDVYHESNGAFTGEVSCEMLLDLKVSTVLVGHSERRHVIGESDELVNLKLRAALDASLWSILCVGETLHQREAGEVEAVNTRQVEMGLEGVPIEQMRQLVIAYEPVWAIGTGRTASPADAESAHRVIRQTLARLYDDATAQAVRIQYGGSVKATNAAELCQQPNVDGFLVGGASLIADEFGSIVQAAADARRSA